MSKEENNSAFKGKLGKQNLKGCLYLILFLIVILILDKILG